MAYTNVTDTVIDDASLDKELLNSAQYWKVRIGETCLFYPKLFKTAYLPIAEITRAFLRIETTVSHVCCGPAEFSIFRVILCGAKGELAAIELDSRTKADRLLAALGERGVLLGKPTA